MSRTLRSAQTTQVANAISISHQTCFSSRRYYYKHIAKKRSLSLKFHCTFLFCHCPGKADFQQEDSLTFDLLWQCFTFLQKMKILASCESVLQEEEHRYLQLSYEECNILIAYAIHRGIDSIYIITLTTSSFTPSELQVQDFYLEMQKKDKKENGCRDMVVLSSDHIDIQTSLNACCRQALTGTLIIQLMSSRIRIVWKKLGIACNVANYRKSTLNGLARQSH